MKRGITITLDYEQADEVVRASLLDSIKRLKSLQEYGVEIVGPDSDHILLNALESVRRYYDNR